MTRISDLRQGTCSHSPPGVGRPCGRPAFFRYTFKGGGGGWRCSEHVRDFLLALEPLATVREAVSAFEGRPGQ